MEDDFHVWDMVNYTRHFEPSIGFVHKYRAEGILLKCNQKITLSEALNYIRRGLNKYGDFLFQIIAMVDDDHVSLKYIPHELPIEYLDRFRNK